MREYFEINRVVVIEEFGKEAWGLCPQTPGV
jgi:hypothetical protein